MGLKIPIAGLLDRAGPPSAAYYGVIDGYVINDRHVGPGEWGVKWSELQPVRGGAIVANNPIDQAIAQVRKLNASGAHLALKLRIVTGINAPNWAKTIGGAPVTVRDPLSGATGTIGRFWTSAFGQAYQDLENKLAARYDKVPEIREVSISRCTTVYAEPFQRDAQDAASRANLLAAGFTVAADEACIEQQIQAHRVWTHTRSDLALNPYQMIVSATQWTPNEKFTEQLMTYCRQVLGSRCILENNSLSSTSLAGNMYRAIKARGPNISFQTAVMNRVGNLLTALYNAASLGAASVELPSGYQTMGAATFALVRSRLTSNPRL
jgi:hypothetical protein